MVLTVRFGAHEGKKVSFRGCLRRFDKFADTLLLEVGIIVGCAGAVDVAVEVFVLASAGSL